MSKLVSICIEEMKRRGIYNDKNKFRFKMEFESIVKKDMEGYFLNLYEKGARGLENENNLLIPYLLGICDTVDFKREPERTIAELPDIDVDFLAEVRDYLKQEWAPKQFGADCVCNIGTYTTYDIKNALLDMARVCDKNHHELLQVTTQMGQKDDDGEKLTWDKALEMYPAFSNYVKDNPEVAEAAQKLCHRIRGMGTHAGGLIISSRPLADFAPVVMNKNHQPQTSWVEGLASQDLQAVGLIKFDLLVITNLLQIGLCLKLIRERHKIDKICALPGQGNWSDISYLNDPEALSMANSGDLTCIFQFDSPGIRQLVRDGGVDSFDDLVAYTSLFRPGPLNCLKEGTLVSTSCGQKPIEKLNDGDKIGYYNSSSEIKYTKNYLVTKTGKKKLLKITTRSGKVLFTSPDHLILTENKKYVEAGKLEKGQKLVVKDKTNKIQMELDEIVEIEEVEEGECYDITLFEDDLYLNEPNFIAENIVVHNCKMHTAYCNRKKGKENYEIHPMLESILGPTYNVVVYQEQIMRILNIVGDIPLDDCESIRKAISKKKVEKFIKYKEMFIENGQKKLNCSEEYVVKMWEQIEAFAAYGFNKSHAVAYTYISSRLLWLKAHYPIEFYCSILSCIGGVDKYDKLREYKKEAEKHNVHVCRLDLNKSDVNFTIKDDKIYYGFSVVKGIGDEVATEIVKGQPYSGFEDFLKRFGPDAKVNNALIGLNIFKEDTPVNLYKFYECYKHSIKKRTERQKRFEKTMIKYEADIKELTEKDPTSISLKTLINRRNKASNIFHEKERLSDECDVTLGIFEPDLLSIDPELKEWLSNEEKAELLHYGFIWTHPLEKCKAYEGFTFERFKTNNIETGPVDVLILDSKLKVSTKKKSFQYYSVKVQDCNYVEQWIVFWKQDYDRFKEELIMGNLVRMRIQAPTNGYSTYSFCSLPARERYKLPPKESDARIIVLSSIEAIKAEEELNIDNEILMCNFKPKKRKEETNIEMQFNYIDMKLDL